MGFNLNVFNIEDVSGNNSAGGPDGWVYTIDLWDHVDEVSGNFQVIDLNNGNDLGDAAGGYTYSGLNTSAYGALTSDGTTGEWTFVLDRDAVLAGGTDQTVTFTIIGADGAGDSDDDSVTINILICLCRGTMVDTPNGPVAVEGLQIGDLVSNADGDPTPLRWIGSRRVTAPEMQLSPDLRPVRIAKGALGANIPVRDLRVSPNHNILIRDWRAELLFSEAEVLVPAKALVNDSTIHVDQTASSAEYFHLLFDQHQIIFTDGAPTESFFPGAFSLRMLSPEARHQLLTLFPGLLEDGGYGDAARPCLTPREGQFLRADFGEAAAKDAA